MPLNFPKCFAVLTVPTFGASAAHDQVTRGQDTVDIPIRVKKARLEVNSHLLADSLSITAEWRDCGIDPRFLKNATIQFWMGNERNEEDIQQDKHLRFIGICTKASRIQRENGGFEVNLDFLDYTCMFLRMKPFPTDGMPSYDDDLITAWNKICDNTGWYSVSEGKIISSVSALRGRVEFRGFGDNPAIPKLGDAVTDRMKKWGKPPIKEECNAWDALQICISMLGLIGYIDRDKLVITSSTEHFKVTRSPRMVWGLNIIEAEESANTEISGKGIHLTSYEPITGTMIESFYPPAGDKRINIKRSVARRKDFDPNTPKNDDYTSYEFNFCQTQAALDRKCQQVYEERARQEIEGRIRTHEMSVEAGDGSQFDLLDLRAGDCVYIGIDPASKELLASFESDEQKLAYLLSQGYTGQVAQLIIRNMDGFTELQSVFHTKQVIFELEDLRWQVEMQYHNLINTDGNTTDTDKVIVAPLTIIDSKGNITFENETIQAPVTVFDNSGNILVDDVPVNQEEITAGNVSPLKGAVQASEVTISSTGSSISGVVQSPEITISDVDDEPAQK